MMAVVSTFSRIGQEKKPRPGALTCALLVAATVFACGAIGTEPDERVPNDGTGAAGTNVHATGSGGASGTPTGATGSGSRGGASVTSGGNAGTAVVSTTATGSAGTGNGGAGQAGAGQLDAGGSGGASDGGGPVTSGSCGTLSRRVFAGEFADNNWLVSWDASARIMFGETNLERISDPQFGSVLRVRYPAGSVNPGATPVGGTQFRSRFGATETLCLSYWLRFDPKFDFVKGGKLPGLCGGDCPSGGDQTNGQSGWSTRYMWRTSGAGEVYAYILPAQAFGTDLGEGKWRFTTGAWHHLEQLVTLNTPGQANGSVRVWYDRKGSEPPDFEAQNLSYRTVSTLKIDQIFFSTFFGGSDSS